MKTVRLGDREGAERIVLLHGLGSNEWDLMSLAPHFLPERSVCSFRAPHEYGPGYAWFDVRWTEDGVTIDLEAARRSCGQLVQEIEALSKGSQPGRTILIGFSQGAMMAMGVATLAPSLISGVVMMSGRLISEFLQTADSNFQSVPFLIQHGTYDVVLPLSDGVEAARALGANGNLILFKEYAMGHEINSESLTDILSWVESLRS